MPNFSRLTTSALVTTTLARTLVAQDSSSTDPRAAQPERPTVATHAYAVAPTYIEMETGVQVAQPHDASLLQAPLVVKIGLAPRLQFDFAPLYTRERNHTDVIEGFNDLAFALKWNAASSIPLFGDVAFQVGLSIPSTPARCSMSHTWVRTASMPGRRGTLGISKHITGM